MHWRWAERERGSRGQGQGHEPEPLARSGGAEDGEKSCLEWQVTGAFLDTS